MQNMKNPGAGNAGATSAEVRHQSTTDVADNREIDRDVWRANAWGALDALAASGVEFTADDVRDAGVGEPPHPNHWGALFLAAQAQQVIRKVAVAPSRNRRSHASAVFRWVGTAPTGSAEGVAQ